MAPKAMNVGKLAMKGVQKYTAKRSPYEDVISSKKWAATGTDADDDKPNKSKTTKAAGVMKRPASISTDIVPYQPAAAGNRQDRNKAHHFHKNWDDLPDAIKHSYSTGTSAAKRTIINELFERDTPDDEWEMQLDKPVFEEPHSQLVHDHHIHTSTCPYLDLPQICSYTYAHDTHS